MDSKVNKFSSGPWSTGCLGGTGNNCKCSYIFNESYMGSLAQVYVDNGIKSISDGGNDCPPEEEAIANMHLMASAPDLLDSVDMVYDLIDELTGFYEDMDGEAFWETMAVIRTNLRWVRKKARNELEK